MSKSEAKNQFDKGNAVICWVNNGKHFVLMKGYSGDTIEVNDPGYNKTSYNLGEVVSIRVYRLS